MKLIVVDVVQKHVHARQVVGGMVYLLSPIATLYHVLAKQLFYLKQQRTRPTSGVVNLVNLGLTQQGKARNKLGNILRGEEFATRLARIGCIIRDKKFVGIAKKVNFMVFKATKVEAFNTLYHGCQAFVFLIYIGAKAVAGGVEVGKQSLNTALRLCSASRTLNGPENIRQVGVKVGVGVGMLSHINKQLAGINHVALSGNGVGHYLAGHILVGHFGIMHLVVAALDILAKVLANKSVEKRT